MPMKTIPQSIVLLQIIKKHLDRYFAMETNSQMIRSTDLYDYLKKQSDFKEKVWSPYAFSRFLRKMHDENILKQIIPNVEVDTTNKKWYQWYFYPPTKRRKQNDSVESINANYHPSKATFFPNNKVYESNNGVKVRSQQEQYILNRLLQEKTFDIYYERPLSAAGCEKYPDFTIYNTETKNIFYWEHFGMLNHPQYDEYMMDKLKWYRQIGYKSINEGGKLIVTRYDDENQFIKSIENIIERLKKIS